MTREEIYNKCWNYINRNPCLLVESATGTGKSKIAIDVINNVTKNKYQGRKTSMLLLVAKKVHKKTWLEEFKKWGGINVDNVIIECYESLGKHVYETFDFVLADEVHHIGSEKRLGELALLHFTYFLGLSATIPRKLKYFLSSKYKAWTVTCDITEAIEDDVLPEPTILLFPMQLENTRLSEEIIINPKATGPIAKGTYKDRWKYKRKKTTKAILQCTQQQKLDEIDSTIQWMKDKYMRSRNKRDEQTWLYLCGKRLEYLADCKIQMVKLILSRLKNYRTITFCKSIKQTELLGANCIHSKNKDAEKVYEDFNNKKIKHITAVNILNENANLVDCKYGIFTNITASDLMMTQRIGRCLRHKNPTLIIPYYVNTREEELIKKHFAEYNQEYIKVIKSLTEI